MTDYSRLEVPGPTVTELSKPFWDAAAQGRLVIQHCTSCERGIFYPRPICPHCWNDALEWRDANGIGRLKSFSQIWKPGHPGWIPAIPYIVGLVELAEGATMLSLILTDGKTVTVGELLRFKPQNIGGRILPCFEISLS
ncbi:Zn-ribbon domain-containing OB-fold protein [Pseudomonas sp. CC6-YY-74]|uniref:Zn-ribbon domain-containing OB-fold protein n=1 Tax=Pseudomonas sp. CC6-YY-74 TaxID=1930532 RepID=UPI0009A13844|nr:zinc ribbon domain-containing protein [Pseudomonas sp. CC6-YY-74]